MSSKLTDPRPTVSPKPAENPPVPARPETPLAPADARPAPKPDVHPDPTRYGDWERKGRCIDF
ncbi:MAG: DUF1674 domain-containing protein [Rhodospirillales bacterium]|nr:DUF1674 domain-containing protein [Rhodospirillales bacterium]